MEIRKVSETATAVTLGWDPVASAAGFRFTVDGKISHTWDGTRTTVRVSKDADRVIVEALGVVDTGTWPNEQPAPRFGADLPARLPASPGPVVEVSTPTELRAALTSAAYGSIIDGRGRTFDGAGAPFEWKRAGSVPTTVRNVKVTNGWIQSVRGKMLRLEDCAVRGSPMFGFRAEYGDNIELVRFRAEDTKMSGYLFALGTVGYQMWDSAAKNVGLGDTLAHGVYIESADNRCVIANHLIDGWEGFGYHLYTGRAGYSTEGLILTCCTSLGGASYAASILDVDTNVGAQPWRNVRIVGLVSVDAPGGIAWVKDSTFADGNRLAGACEWPKGSRSDANYQIDRLAPVAHILADPLLDAAGRPAPGSPVKSLVPADWHGLVPALDRDGKARVTADAGAYAV